MHKFALIAEGWTDVAVIENIIYGALGDDAVVNPLMPLRDATDAARHSTQNFSNWELVLEYLSTDQVRLALAANDYLIVQIDTDQAEHPNFGLQLTANGNLKPIAQIVHECKQLLLSRLPNQLSQEDRSRVLFAIPVLSTECWLIGLLNELHLHSPSKANNCEHRLHLTLKGRNKLVKDYRCYKSLSQGFKKSKALNSVRLRVECLELFVASTQHP